MTHPIAPSVPAGTGDADRLSPRGPRFAARRRMVLLVMLLILGGVTALANYSPARAHRDAQARLEQAVSAVSTLEGQKAELRSQLGKLSEAGYLESMAREELSFTRPGEQLYIVTGMEDSDTSDDGANGAVNSGGQTAGADQSPGGDEDDAPGLFERALGALLGLF